MQDRRCIDGEKASWVQAYIVMEFCVWGDIHGYLTEPSLREQFIFVGIALIGSALNCAHPLGAWYCFLLR